MSAPVILLDRDGVLNVDLPTGVLRQEALEMVPGSAEAVARLCQAGYRVLVCSNQACVGRGELSLDELKRINARISAAVRQAGGAISAWYICPHRAEENCDCRKPQPGLLLQAQAAYDFDLATTCFVGDAVRDVQAAEAAGCQPILVRTGKGRASESEVPHVQAFDDLYAVADQLLNHN